MDAYEKLANAIILQAVKDYRHALKLLARNSKCTSALSTKAECERFFPFREVSDADIRGRRNADSQTERGGSLT